MVRANRSRKSKIKLNTRNNLIQEHLSCCAFEQLKDFMDEKDRQVQVKLLCNLEPSKHFFDRNYDNMWSSSIK